MAIDFDFDGIVSSKEGKKKQSKNDKLNELLPETPAVQETKQDEILEGFEDFFDSPVDSSEQIDSSIESKEDSSDAILPEIENDSSLDELLNSSEDEKESNKDSLVKEDEALSDFDFESEGSEDTSLSSKEILIDEIKDEILVDELIEDTPIDIPVIVPELKTGDELLDDLFPEEKEESSLLKDKSNEELEDMLSENKEVAKDEEISDTIKIEKEEVNSEYSVKDEFDDLFSSFEEEVDNSNPKEETPVNITEDNKIEESSIDFGEDDFLKDMSTFTEERTPKTNSSEISSALDDIVLDSPSIAETPNNLSSSKDTKQNQFVQSNEIPSENASFQSLGFKGLNNKMKGMIGGIAIATMLIGGGIGYSMKSVPVSTPVEVVKEVPKIKETIINKTTEIQKSYIVLTSASVITMNVNGTVRAIPFDSIRSETKVTDDTKFTVVSVKPDTLSNEITLNKEFTFGELKGAAIMFKEETKDVTPTTGILPSSNATNSGSSTSTNSGTQTSITTITNTGVIQTGITDSVDTTTGASSTGSSILKNPSTSTDNSKTDLKNLIN